MIHTHDKKIHDIFSRWGLSNLIMSVSKSNLILQLINHYKDSYVSSGYSYDPPGEFNAENQVNELPPYKKSVSVNQFKPCHLVLIDRSLIKNKVLVENELWEEFFAEGLSIYIWQEGLKKNYII
jgi:hypothetical protein